MVSYSIGRFFMFAAILPVAFTDPFVEARRTYAHCKNATRETGIWKLDTELYQGVRNTFNQHLTMQEEWGYDDFDEDEPFGHGVRGTSGTKEWTLEKTEAGWRIARLIEGDQVALHLPRSPPFVYVSYTTTIPKRRPRQHHPMILSRWIHGETTESNMPLFSPHHAVISMTALPFNTTREVVSFLSLVESTDFGLRVEEQQHTARATSKLEAKEEAVSAARTAARPKEQKATTSSKRLEVPKGTLPEKHRSGTDKEVTAKATFPTSISRLYDYAYFVIASMSPALIVIVTCRYGGTIVEKLKAVRGQEGECDQLRALNESLKEQLSSQKLAIEALQERLRLAEQDIVEFEAFKEQVSAREAELKSEVDSLRSAAEEYAQNERLLQEHYVQARAISRRKEAELKERLEEQCIISESLNDAVEEMQRLITTMIEANETTATGSLQDGVQDGAPCQVVAAEARRTASHPDVPVDPITSGVPANAAVLDDDAIQRFVTTVYTTLYSLPHGYDSIPRLLSDLSEDSGLNGEETANELGYESFEAFLLSPEMAPRILVGALPDGRRLYKVYPTKFDLERYVAQQLGTDYGDTKRALARQREENNRLRRQLTLTLDRVEKLKRETLKPTRVHDASRFRPPSTKTHTPAGNNTGTIPGTDPARFHPAASKKDVDGPSTSRAAYDPPAPPSASSQALSEASTPSLEVRRHIDELERMVHCAICMDRPKDTAFACGDTYCNECAVELRQCTFGCKKQNGKPLTFNYRVFL